MLGARWLYFEYFSVLCEIFKDVGLFEGVTVAGRDGDEPVLAGGKVWEAEAPLRIGCGLDGAPVAAGAVGEGGGDRPHVRFRQRFVAVEDSAGDDDRLVGERDREGFGLTVRLSALRLDLAAAEERSAQERASRQQQSGGLRGFRGSVGKEPSS